MFTLQLWQLKLAVVRKSAGTLQPGCASCFLPPDLSTSAPRHLLNDY